MLRREILFLHQPGIICMGKCFLIIQGPPESFLFVGDVTRIQLLDAVRVHADGSTTQQSWEPRQRFPSLRHFSRASHLHLHLLVHLHLSVLLYLLWVKWETTPLCRHGPDAFQLWTLRLLGVVVDRTSTWSLLWLFNSHNPYKCLQNGHLIQL